MSSTMIGIIFIIIMFVLLAIRVPVAIAMAVPRDIGYFVFPGLERISECY